MEKVDILFVGGSFPMPDAGGSINYVIHLLTGIDDMSYTVLTANWKFEQNQCFDTKYKHKIIRSKLIRHALNSNPGNFFNRNIRLLYSIFYVALCILRYKPKIVFFTEYSFLSIGYYLTNPLVHAKLGLFTYSEEIHMILNHPFHYRMLKRVLKDSNILITVCEYTKKMLINIEKTIENKVVTIIPPVVIPQTQPIANKSSNRSIILLTVARLVERKGHVDVLEALARLKHKYSNIRYVIVGEGPYENIIRKRISDLSLNHFVDLKGKVSESELEHYYSSSDVFVMPHKQLKNGDTEGCPTVFLEASLHKLPVIGGEAGGVSDAIVDGVTGYICHLGTDELYLYLDKLISSQPLRISMGESGYEYATQFSIHNQSGIFRKLIIDKLK